MNQATPETRTEDDWRRLHAFGLPAGSIPALLAVMIFATTWGLLLIRPDQEVPDYLSDLLFIIMGHYFASRHRADQGDEPGPPPLYLPPQERPALAGLRLRRGSRRPLPARPVDGAAGTPGWSRSCSSAGFWSAW